MSDQIELREIKELKDKEPASELFDRYVDLQLERPKAEALTFEKYLHLKTYLAIHSSLARRHIFPEDAEIKKILKKLAQFR